MEQKLIDRINFLSRESKVRELTVEELEEQAALRKAYINSFKNNLRQQLDNLDITYVD